jgi:hypothetical protein
MKKIKNISLEIPPHNFTPEPVSPTTSREPDYPTLHLDGKTELHLPKEGEITFHYCLVSETSSENKKGEHRYQCTLEIKELCSVEGEKDERPSRRDTSAEDSLDSLMKKKQEEEESDDDDDDDEDY